MHILAGCNSCRQHSLSLQHQAWLYRPAGLQPCLAASLVRWAAMLVVPCTDCALANAQVPCCRCWRSSSAGEGSRPRHCGRSCSGLWPTYRGASSSRPRHSSRSVGVPDIQNWLPRQRGALQLGSAPSSFLSCAGWICCPGSLCCHPPISSQPRPQSAASPSDGTAAAWSSRRWPCSMLLSMLLLTATHC